VADGAASARLMAFPSEDSSSPSCAPLPAGRPHAEDEGGLLEASNSLPGPWPLRHGPPGVSLGPIRSAGAPRNDSSHRFPIAEEKAPLAVFTEGEP